MEQGANIINSSLLLSKNFIDLESSLREVIAGYARNLKDNEEDLRDFTLSVYKLIYELYLMLNGNDRDFNWQFIGLPFNDISLLDDKELNVDLQIQEMQKNMEFLKLKNN